MFNLSSPRGSSSYQQLHDIISSFENFYVDYLAKVGSASLFENVAESMTQMLTGHGLRKTHNIDKPSTILFGTLFMNETGFQYIINKDTAVILIQTEQLCCSSYLSDAMFRNLQGCEVSQNCVILEYSEHNYDYMNDLGISSSVVLLPTLLQGRLDKYYRRHHLPGEWERSTDVAFYGSMTPRREKLLGQINNPHPDKPAWNMLLEENNEKAQIVQTYLHTKICLAIHAFHANSPGEYHRLSEIGVSGCIPVMENFGETIGLDVYKTCGGLILADFDRLTNTIADILEDTGEEDEHEAARQRRSKWWLNRVEWNNLLLKLFQEESIDIDDFRRREEEL
jgi:hypothetical protein